MCESTNSASIESITHQSIWDWVAICFVLSKSKVIANQWPINSCIIYSDYLKQDNVLHTWGSTEFWENIFVSITHYVIDQRLFLMCRKRKVNADLNMLVHERGQYKSRRDRGAGKWMKTVNIFAPKRLWWFAQRQTFHDELTGNSFQLSRPENS